MNSITRLSPSNISLSSEAVAEVHQFNPRCHVWATGLHGLMENGVEVYVDMPKDAENKELVLIARSSEDCRAKCANTLQQVIQKVIEVKVEYCHSIQPSVYLLDPVQLEDVAFANARSVPLYSLKDVEQTLAEGRQRAVSIDGHYCVPLTKLISLTRWKMSYWSKLLA